MNKHGFVFTVAALAMAGALMSWNKRALAVDPAEGAAGNFPEGFDPSEGPALQDALEAHVPDDVDDHRAWLSAICEEADPATWAQVQAMNAAYGQAQADVQRERHARNERITAAITAAAGVDAFWLGLGLQSGIVGTAPSATRAIEVPGEGTFHIFGLEGLEEKLRASMPPGMVDMLRDLSKLQDQNG